MKIDKHSAETGKKFIKVIIANTIYGLKLIVAVVTNKWRHQHVKVKFFHEISIPHVRIVIKSSCSLIVNDAFHIYVVMPWLCYHYLSL